MSAESKAVFLSYASQDAEVARRICDALRAAGVEVWFDQSELRGGDAWDAKIRKQIKECALFAPVISANTQARREGYFRREWKLAVDRTHDMDEALPFLLPVVIDDTRDAEAFVPEKFREVQWTRLPGGTTSPAFCNRLQGLLEGEGGGGAPRSPAAPPSRRAQSGKPNRVAVATGVLASVCAAIGLALWRPWRVPSVQTPPSKVSSALDSPASKLIARAWEQLNKPELYRAELEIADDLCKQATALNSEDPMAWAAWSQVDSQYLYHGADSSDARRESARAKATRALKLDPHSFEARFAEAAYLVRGTPGSASGATPPDNPDPVIARLRELLKERPSEPRVCFVLGLLLRNAGNLTGAVEAFEQMARTPAFAATATSETGWAFWQKREYAEAANACARSLALHQFRSNLLLEIYLAMTWEGDLEHARATLMRVPSHLLLEDDFAVMAARIHWWRRDPTEVRRVLNAIPRRFLSWQSIPKDYFVGESYRMQRNEEAAQVAWKEALRATEEQIAKGGAPRLAPRRAHLLALLGREEDAAHAVRLLDAGGWPTDSPIGTEFRDWAIALARDKHDEALDLLEKGFEAGNRWAPTWAMLQLNPLLDPLRDQPRFKALLARAEVDATRNPHAKTKSVPAAALAPTAKSVAVLAFENRSSEKDSEYFSDGISEELLNVLAKVPGLKVVGRSSSFQFKGKQEPPQDVGRKLNVTHLVEGSVQRSGTQARIIARLIRADTGEQIWGDGFNSELKDILVAQQDIARVIAEKLSVTFGGADRPTKTVNPAAHRHVLEGRYFIARRWAGFAAAEEAFSEAVKIDPNFAPAHAGVAEVNMLHGLYIMADGRGPVADKFARAKVAARRAMELDPTLAEPHATLGLLLFMEREWIQAERHFQQTFQLNPNNGMAYHWHGLLLGVVGKLDAALEALARSVDLDPLGHTSFFTYGGYLYAAGRFAESVEAMDRGLPIATPTATLPAYHSIRAVALHQLGRTDEAVTAARTVRQMPRGPSHTPHWWSDGDAIFVLQRTGHTREAEEYLRDVERNAGAKSHIYGYALCALGRFDEGVPLLAQAEPMCQSKLYFMPMFESLHGTARFDAVIAKLNSSAEYKLARETLARLRRAEPKK